MCIKDAREAERQFKAIMHRIHTKAMQDMVLRTMDDIDALEDLIGKAQAQAYYMGKRKDKSECWI